MSLPALLRAPLRVSLAVPAPSGGDGPPACPSCGAEVPRRYCGDCGESPAADDLSLGALLAAGIEQLTALDVKLLRTIRLLVTRPGALTVEYRRGVRARYTRPMQLFLLVLAAFFVAMSHLTFLTGGRGAELAERKSLVQYKPKIAAMQRAAGETPVQFYARFDGRAADVKRGLAALFVPALALTLAVLHARRGRYFVEHTAFATHLFTFSLIMYVGWIALMQGTTRLIMLVRHAAGLPPAHLSTDGWQVNAMAGTSVLALLAVAGWYIWQAMRRAYGTSGWATTWRTVVLGVVLMIGAVMYPSFLFRLTLATL